MAENEAREFVLQTEKALRARRLYPAHSSLHADAAKAVFEKARLAIGTNDLTLTLSMTDLFVERVSLIHRPKREDAFFFPLYRDGLRDLTFTPELTLEDVEALLSVFEAEEKKQLSAVEDTVMFLWRSEMRGITYNAVDGIGDQESTGGSGGGDGRADDYQALVAELMAQIKTPAAPETGQGYAFVLDADVRVAQTDFHYEAGTVRRAFEDNPRVLDLTAREADSLRGEASTEREADLLGRFAEILLTIIEDPALGDLDVAPVMARLLEGFWLAGDVESLTAYVGWLRGAHEGGATPEGRRTAEAVLGRFFTGERLNQITEKLGAGSLELAYARPLLDAAGPAAFAPLLDLQAGLRDGPLKSELGEEVRARIRTDAALLRGALGSASPQVRAALSFVTEADEPFYAAELIALTRHADEAVRQKALGAARRIGTRPALESLWNALENDPSRPVRLLAFRLLEGADLPWLGERVLALASRPDFAARPQWEKEKLVWLLATQSPQKARPLFESWLPKKRWLWRPDDREWGELATKGLVLVGAEGRALVVALRNAGGKLGAIAAKALAADSAAEPRSSSRG